MFNGQLSFVIRKAGDGPEGLSAFVGLSLASGLAFHAL